MNFPKIDISALPDLNQLTGTFGSLLDPIQKAITDDTFVDVLIFIYDVAHPTRGG